MCIFSKAIIVHKMMGAVQNGLGSVGDKGYKKDEA